ncbi:MAG: putative ATP-grasp superfamily ATP-dependent carboligase [Gammaproteobacteria bacterium]|jgi:predicted ATP-grasp superfamily ATP-dependent carboligase
MRHFLHEFITGGGLSGQALPETLIREGEIMIQTLLFELIEAGYSDIALTRDKRLDSCEHKVKQYIVRESLEEELPEYISKSDVAWLIAPETGDCLARLAELFIRKGNIFVGSSPDAIRVASSKLLTCRMLAEANVKIVNTRALDDEIPASETGWIIKPNDGVGGESCYFIKDKKRLAEITAEKKNNNFVIQPFINGRHMSMSLLVFDDAVRLLGCNEQHVNIKDEDVSLSAIGVNECLFLRDKMMCLATKIVSKISGFAGYIGVDMIEVNSELYVLEINPRFTTAYAGLSESLGINITKKILDTFLKKTLPEIDLTVAVPIRITI